MYIKPQPLVLPRLRGELLVPTFLSFTFAQPVDADKRAVYGWVFVTGIVPPVNVQFIVLDDNK